MNGSGFRTVTAVDLARSAGVDPKRYRRALRAARLDWHAHQARWAVDEGSPQHHDMLRVMRQLGREAASRPS